MPNIMNKTLSILFYSIRPITEVKQRRARSVLGWVTAWEHRVPLPPNTFCFFFFFLKSIATTEPICFSCRYPETCTDPYHVNS
jgi:hypothetical protein